MNWELRIDSDVKKFLKRIPKNDAERIDAVIEVFVLNPNGGLPHRQAGM